MEGGFLMRSCRRANAKFALVSLLIFGAACSSVASRRAQHVRDGVTEAVEQVQLGMSRADVLSLMGEPQLKRAVRLKTNYEVWDYRSEDVAMRQGILERRPWVWLDPRYYVLKENLRYDIRISITFVQGQVVHVSMI
jgi:outer membrane protein assembly factor BamE (lipoprotein component of BamABCDE complex)